MARKLTGEHLERVRAAAEQETGRRKKEAPEREKESLERSIKDAEWQIGQLKAKIAELQGMLKALEAKEGLESEPIALERPAAIPDAWLRGSQETEALKLWEATMLEGRPEGFQDVYRRWIGERRPGKATWLPGDFQHDIRELARGSGDPRLEEVRTKHYPGWEKEDFQALGELLGIEEMPAQTAVETEDGEALAALFESRITRLEDHAQDAADFRWQMENELSSFSKAQGIDLEGLLEERDERYVTDTWGERLQTVRFMGREIARVEPTREEHGVGTFHFDSKQIKEAIRDFLVEQGIAYGGAK